MTSFVGWMVGEGRGITREVAGHYSRLVGNLIGKIMDEEEVR